MKEPMCAVYDMKTGLFSKPFTVRHVAEAVREFDIVRKDTNTKIGKNPEDFQLFQIADFDLTTGEAITLKPHLHIASGV